MSNPMGYGPPTLQREEPKTVLRSDRYRKEDPELAEAVLTTLHMGLSPLIAAWGEQQTYDDAEVLARFMSYKTFLMDVFRAVRGERD